MGWKEDFISRYGKTKYNQRKLRIGEWRKKNRKSVETAARELGHKGGRYYEKALIYKRTGIQRKRNVTRHRHGKLWREYKQIVAPESVLHHEWITESSEYKGVALVEKNQHQHGFIDVIKIVAGKITIYTEAELLEPQNTSLE
jgi:hypothetical protein